MELAERISQAASAQGILAAALPDAVARGERHFTLPPTDRELETWAASLHVSAPHFFASQARETSDSDVEGTPPGVPPSVWKAMSASAKLGWAREHGYGPKPVQRRPTPLTLTSEQAAVLAALPPAQRVTMYRALQDATQARKD